MRQITSIPHPQMRITVYLWNGKYIIKCEAGPYEQAYKLDEMMISNPLEINTLITESFLEKVVARFRDMNTDFSELLT